jgi:hypothetical protein
VTRQSASPDAPLQRLLRRTWRARLAWIRNSGRATGVRTDSFPADLAEEGRAIDARVRATIRAVTARRRGRFPVSHFLAANHKVGACCRLDPRNHLPRIDVNLGTLLAIDDLALFSATLDGYLIPNREAFRHAPPGPNYRLTEAVEAEGEYLAHPGRFYDYREAFRRGVGIPGIITFAMPKAAWRLAQAGLVAELAIAWVLCHEYAHWALAHLSLLDIPDRAFGFAERPDARPAGFSIARGRSPVAIRRNVKISRVLELHADAAAFHLIVNYADRARGPIRRFERAMALNPRRSVPQCLSEMDEPQVLRLCLTAAALACIVLDGYGGGRRSPRSAHPSPSARFMNMISHAPVAVPGLLEEVDGALVVGDGSRASFDVERLGESMGLALTDARLMAGIATLARQRDNRPGELDPRLWHRSGWRADMRRQWRTGAESPIVETGPGRELARLPLDDDALEEKLKEIQFRAFGTLFDIYIRNS